MKVQITVDDEVWRQAKANAALKGVSLGEFVGEALGKVVNVISENRRERSSVASGSKSGVTRRAAMEDKADGPARPVQQTGDAIKGGSTPSTPATPTPEEVEAKQRSCKHAFIPGNRACVKCGWVPPIMG